MGDKLTALCEKSGTKPPKMYQVNWFRRDSQGNFVWPGFGQNMRVLEWIIERIEGRVDAVSTPIGLVPKFEDMNWQESDFTKADFETVTSQDKNLLLKELDSHQELFDKLGERMPQALIDKQKAIRQAIENS